MNTEQTSKNIFMYCQPTNKKQKQKKTTKKKLSKE